MCNSKPKFDYKVVFTTKDINSKDWNSLTSNNIFLDIDYLDTIEKTVSEVHQFVYVLYYDEIGRPVGKSIFQVLKYDTKNFNFDSVPCRFQNKILKKFLNNQIMVLVAGNIFATGENAFYFQKSINDTIIFENVNNVANELLQENRSINYTVFKEFYPANNSATNMLKNQEYLKFNIDANMVLDLKNHWNSFEDVMLDYRTKYRSRFNKALLKSNGLTVRDLNGSDIRKYSTEFQNLYKQVLQNSNFNLGIFNIETFIGLKEKLSDKYTVFGYFVDDKLIGFRSSFVKNGTLETSFVGIDYNLNQTYNLYPKMLVDFINDGFKNNATSIGFGRTAETMKSAFGAKPLNMSLFIRSRTKVGKFLLRLIVQNINPTEFKLRKPFKKEFYTEQKTLIDNGKVEKHNNWFIKFNLCPFNGNNTSNI